MREGFRTASGLIASVLMKLSVVLGGTTTPKVFRVGGQCWSFPSIESTLGQLHFGSFTLPSSIVHQLEGKINSFDEEYSSDLGLGHMNTTAIIVSKEVIG